jgi:hypothetical protein
VRRRPALAATRKAARVAATGKKQTTRVAQKA